jgi:hypothetical protein
MILYYRLFLTSPYSKPDNYDTYHKYCDRKYQIRICKQTGNIIDIENSISSKKRMVMPDIIPRDLVTFCILAHPFAYISNCACDGPFSISIPSLSSMTSPILLPREIDLP